MIALLLITFFVLLALDVLITMSLGLSAMDGIPFLDGDSMAPAGQRMSEGMNSFALLAIPLYTLVGFTMSKGDISDRLTGFCYPTVGRFTGGPTHVNVLSSMIFVGISGSVVVDTAGVSGMIMSQVVKKGYSKKLMAAVTVISSMIGIVILPSIPMVVIAEILGISTGKLFLGGIIPGIMLGVTQMAVFYFLAKREGVPKEEGYFDMGELLKYGWESLPTLLMPIIIVGSIITGVVSPTEAGAIAVVYGLTAGGLIYKELKWVGIEFVLRETAKTSAEISLVTDSAKLLTVMLITAGFDKWVANTMPGVSNNPTIILVLILLIFFIVTMFMESITTPTLFMPVIYLIAMAAGIDPTVMSVLTAVVIGIGLVIPSVGMCIYVAYDLMEMRVGQVMETLVPHLAVTLVVLALLIAFLQLILLPTGLVR